MAKCTFCLRYIWPWEKWDDNRMGHRVCRDIWDNGHKAGARIVEAEYVAHGFPPRSKFPDDYTNAPVERKKPEKEIIPDGCCIVEHRDKSEREAALIERLEQVEERLTILEEALIFLSTLGIAKVHKGPSLETHSLNDKEPTTEVDRLTDEEIG